MREGTVVQTGSVNRDDKDSRARAQVLVIEEASAGSDVGYFLVRFSVDGTSLGDSWHLTLNDARDCASREFPLIAEWLSIPDSVEDLIAFLTES